MLSQDLLTKRLTLYEGDSFIAANNALCCVAKAADAAECVN